MNWERTGISEGRNDRFAGTLRQAFQNGVFKLACDFE